MPISTKIDIEIAGEALSRFSKLVINQKVQSHHKFSLLQPLPKEFVSQAMDKAQQYVGQPIRIVISPSTMYYHVPEDIQKKLEYLKVILSGKLKTVYSKLYIINYSVAKK
jgi:hypothetical protein